ncbi:hypothetical protein EVG20_g5757 [Dentipellis fragilis]|uniref:Uncharacterized protein n=1 Tax=Dentipellis fragilis TaxID=205917 RepID=A0A4Y9YRG3_9AGAM|nr:hypothetical protein EVG20_g5757 [Dentipellis fragilis]
MLPVPAPSHPFYHPDPSESVIHHEREEEDAIRPPSGYASHLLTRLQLPSWSMRRPRPACTTPFQSLSFQSTPWRCGTSGAAVLKRAAPGFVGGLFQAQIPDEEEERKQQEKILLSCLLRCSW